MKTLRMKSNPYEGMLITFCGLDGCGKTTMIQQLITDLNNKYTVFATKQPTNSVRNSQIFRTYMDNPDHSAYDYRSLSLLAASDRVQHVNKVILPKLKDGQVVISDRYYYSCLANLFARGFEDDQWIYEISESIIRPDIAFFFDASVETAISRVRSRPEERDRYIDLDLQYKLRKTYLEICKKNNGVLISTEQPIEDTYEQMRIAVERKLKQKNDLRKNC